MEVTNKKFKIKSQNSGFTLIEIVVVFGILALIGGLTSDLFASILKGTNKANTVNEIKQNGNYALSRIERAVRNSSSVVYWDNNNLILNVSDGESNNCVKFTIVPANTVTKTNGRIDLYNASSCIYDDDGYNDTETFYDVRGSSLMNSNDYSGVSLADGSFSVSSVSGSPSVVLITFTLSQGEKANSRNDYTASEVFQSFISLRTH